MSASLLTGQVALSSTPTPLSTSALEVAAFIVKAPVTNVDPLEIGSSTLTLGTGFTLSPGETLRFDFGTEAGEAIFDRQPQDIYVVGSTGDTAVWLAGGRP